MRLSLSILVFVLAAFATCEKVSYKGYKLVHVSLNDQEQLEFLNSFENVDREYDMWGVKKNGDGYLATIMLSPQVLDKYLNVFRGMNVDAKIVSHNVQDLLDAEEKTIERFNGTARNILHKFPTYNEIVSFLKDTAYENPELCTYYSAGQSWEKRDIPVIRFKTPTATRAIWIDAGIHAREWATPATGVYFVHQLLHELKTNVQDTIDLLAKYEVHIAPTLNPDGYEFSRVSDRLWRKNRRDKPNLLGCYGVDLNRNFPFKWGTGGSSTISCIDTYMGPTAGSEPETKAVISALTAPEMQGKWDAYYSCHTYGNWWLLPWGDTTTVQAPNHKDLMDNAEIGLAAIKAAYGEVFIAGQSSILLYITSGSSADWAYGALNILFGIILELRPGTGSPENGVGFEIPEASLKQIAEETWAGIKASWKDISNRTPVPGH